MGELTKGLIGKQDLSIQYNTNATETFERIASTGGSLELSKFPDIWTGTGKINVAAIDVVDFDFDNLIHTDTTHENYWGLTDLDYPATLIDIVEGSLAAPVTVNEPMTYSERHCASLAGDADEWYDSNKWVTFLESGHLLNTAIARFDLFDRSGDPNHNSISISTRTWSHAASSAKGLWGCWHQVVDHADTDTPSLCGIEIGLTVRRNGLDYTSPLGTTTSRNGIQIVNDGTVATEYQAHTGLLIEGNTKKWAFGLAFRNVDLGIVGYTVTDTDIEGIIRVSNSGDTAVVFSVSNTGHIRTAVNLTLQANTANAGSIIFGSDGNDYLTFDGSNYSFLVAAAIKARLDTSGNWVLYGALYTGGATPLQVVGARVIDARCDDVVDNTYGAEEAGVLDALRDAMISHGLISAA